LPSFRQLGKEGRVRSAVTVGRFIGVPIKVHLSFPPVFAFVTWLLVTRYFPALVPGLPLLDRWVAGLVGSLVLFGSLLAHEFGHAVVARRFGCDVRSVSLFFLGGMVEINAPDTTPAEELFIALAGPAASLFLGLLDAVGWFVVGPEHIVLWLLFLYLALSNLLLGLFNLLPGYPLDGGRILRAGLWHFFGDRDRAEAWANWCGRGLGGFAMAGGVILIVAGRFVDGFWLAVIGTFLLASIFQTSAITETSESSK
jgi:Zn-dependent protease